MSLEFCEKGRFVHVGGIKLYVYDSADYRSYESPTTLVFLHGYPGQMGNWKYQVPFFEERYRVIAYDQRGFGRSDKPKVANMEDFTGDLEALLRELGVRDEDAVLVGHSFGGMVAQAYARDHRVMGLVLVGSLTRFRRDVDDYIISYLPAAFWKPLFFTMNPLTRQLYRKVYLSPESPFSVLEEFYEDNKDYLLELPASSYRYKKHMLDYDATRWLSEVKSPALVIAGEHDYIAPVEEAEKIHSLLPNSRLVVIKRAGHLVLYEKYDELNKTILDFVQQLERGAPVQAKA